eukprot:c151_g2_i1.p1 GENE.c151_g2_i1~~c151_g2_i1.p1  ORF type:complete len:139 (+),score=43.07 c151_g2_i1:512-928(+)
MLAREIACVDQLTPEKTGLSLYLHVIKVEIVVERPDLDICVAQILVGDHTANILLTALNEQIDQIALAKHIKLTNAHIEMTHGRMYLVVGEFGLIETISTATSSFHFLSTAAKEHIEQGANITNPNLSLREFHVLPFT